MDSREIRGLAILAKGDNPISVQENQWLVPSQSSGKKYKVAHADIWSCDCLDFQNRQVECKHIHAIKFLEKVKATNDVSELGLSDAVNANKKTCPSCDSEKIISNGKRIGKSGARQRYECKECHKRFVLEPIKYVKADTKLISLTMDLYYKGLSLRDISDTLFQFYGIKIHFDTVRRWIVRFTKKMNEYTNQHTPTIGGIVHTDEQVIRSNGENIYAWNTIDSETRFLLASTVSRNREIKDARKHFQEVKANSNKDPSLIITDGYQGYPRAIKKEFKTMRKKTQHLSIVGHRKSQNNNLIERYNNDFREFDKVRRGFKSKKTTQEWANGFRLFHNHIHQNPTIQTTPALKAGINLGLSRNKWKSLLEASVGKEATRVRQE